MTITLEQGFTPYEILVYACGCGSTHLTPYQWAEKGMAHIEKGLRCKECDRRYIKSAFAARREDTDGCIEIQNRDAVYVMKCRFCDNTEWFVEQGDLDGGVECTRCHILGNIYATHHEWYIRKPEWNTADVTNDTYIIRYEIDPKLL